MNKLDLTKTQIVDPPIEVEGSCNKKTWFTAKLFSIDYRLNKPFTGVDIDDDEITFTYARHIQTKIKVPDNIHVRFFNNRCVLLFNDDKQKLFVDDKGIYSIHKNTYPICTQDPAQLIPADKNNLEIGCGYYFVWNGYKFKYIDDIFHYGIYNGKDVITISPYGFPKRLLEHDEKDIDIYKIIPDED